MGSDRHPLLMNVRWLRARYVDEGLSVAGLARQLGVARSTVQNALDRAGIPRRPAGPVRKLDQAVLDALDTTGGVRPEVITEVARTAGVQRRTVTRALAARGTPVQTVERAGPSWTALRCGVDVEAWRAVALIPSIEDHVVDELRAESTDEPTDGSGEESGDHPVDEFGAEPPAVHAGRRGGGSGGVTLIPAATVVPRADWVAQAFLCGYGPKTRSTYATALRQWYTWCADHHLDVLSVHGSHIQAWGRHLRECRRLARRTVAGMLVAVGGLYRYACLDGLIPRNPAVVVRAPRCPRISTTNGLARDELAEILAAAKDDEDPMVTALVSLLALNGLRLGETLAIDIEHLGTYGALHTVHLPERKNGAVQTVSLSDRTAHAVLAARGDRENGPLLLGPTRAGRMRRQIAADRVRRIATQVAITRRITPRSFRNTFVTLSRDAGAHDRDIMASTGHTDPSMIVYYDQARAAIERNATHLLTAYLNAA